MKTNILFLALILALFSCKNSGGGGSICDVQQPGQSCGGDSGGGSGGGGTGGGGGDTGGGGDGTTPDPFQVTIYDPMDGVTDFGVDDNLSVQFNNDLNPSSVFYSGSSMDNVSITNNQTSEKVFLEVIIENSLLTINPMFSLEPNTGYTVTLDTSLMDMNGQYLQEAVTFSFRTAAEQGTNPGNQVVLGFNNTANEDRNIEVYDFRVLFGQTQRVGNPTFVGYDHEVRIDMVDAQQNYDPVTRRYSYILDQNVQTGQSYYLSMKACNNVCSDYSAEIQKTVE